MREFREYSIFTHNVFRCEPHKPYGCLKITIESNRDKGIPYEQGDEVYLTRATIEEFKIYLNKFLFNRSDIKKAAIFGFYFWNIWQAIKGK